MKNAREHVDDLVEWIDPAATSIDDKFASVSGEIAAGQASTKRRLAITVGLPLLILLGRRLPAAGVDVANVSALRLPLDTLNPFSVGILPLISAHVVVEVLALLHKPWRERRHHWPEGRASIERLAWWLALVLAAVQALALTLAAEAMGRSAPAVIEDGLGWVFGLSVLAGSAPVGWSLSRRAALISQNSR